MDQNIEREIDATSARPDTPQKGEDYLTATAKEDSRDGLLSEDAKRYYSTKTTKAKRTMFRGNA